MLGSPTRLCRDFFEQQLKSWLAVFRNDFFYQILLKTRNIRKLQDWSFRLWKNYFCKSNIEHARRSQNSITFFLYTLYST